MWVWCGLGGGAAHFETAARRRQSTARCAGRTDCVAAVARTTQHILSGWPTERVCKSTYHEPRVFAVARLNRTGQVQRTSCDGTGPLRRYVAAVPQTSRHILSGWPIVRVCKSNYRAPRGFAVCRENRTAHVPACDGAPGAAANALGGLRGAS